MVKYKMHRAWRRLETDFTPAGYFVKHCLQVTGKPLPDLVGRLNVVRYLEFLNSLLDPVT